MRLLPGFKAGVVFGLALGLLLGLCVMQYLREEIFYEYSQDFVDNMVPALFAAIATILASLFAISGVAWNIKNQNHLVQEDRRLKLMSARASLSAALDELGRVCKLHILKISRKGKYYTGESMELSDRTVDTMKQIIENSPYNVQDNISDLLNFYQIAKAKYRQLDATYKNNPNKINRPITSNFETETAVHWASLKALVSCYYNYGRGDSFTIDRNNAYKSFENELIFFGQDDEAFLMSGNTNISRFSKYLNKKDFNGCGFLDPNYWAKGGLVKEDASTT